MEVIDHKLVDKGREWQMSVLWVVVLVVLAGVGYAYKKKVGKFNKFSWVGLALIIALLSGGFFLYQRYDKRINYKNLIAPSDAVWEVYLDQQKVDDLYKEDKDMRKDVAREHKIAKAENIDDIKIQNELIASSVVREVNEQYYEIIKYMVEHNFRMSSLSIQSTRNYIHKSGTEFHKAAVILADGFGESEMSENIIDNMNAINNLGVILDMIQNKDDIDLIADYSVNNFFNLFNKPYKYFGLYGDAFTEIMDQAVPQDS